MSDTHASSVAGSLATRLLGVGLAAALAATTIALALTGQLALYINPDGAWFAVSMAVIALIGAVASFLLPLGAEADHGHDHGGAGHGFDTPPLRGGTQPPESRRAARESSLAARSRSPRERSETTRGDHSRPRVTPGGVLVAIGGVVATGIVATIVVTPPAVLSTELAMSRDLGAAPLFQDADTVQLAATGDTASFGVGDWVTVFATATDPEAFAGTRVALTGFVTPADAGFQLTRMVVTHCVIDAQPAVLPIAATDVPATGEWVTVTGTVRDDGGRLVIEAAEVETIDQPKDPYEY
ncbi:TIGR03943 family putative permease subunit [Microbacterium sp. bgisy189]|uniref:TIGR03943 family putative permease subunit n=1 Tax=Microbacterium sp. bgisy189 TaxID=3413798 RepID=UPI003EBB5FA3